MSARDPDDIFDFADRALRAMDPSYAKAAREWEAIRRADEAARQLEYEPELPFGGVADPRAVETVGYL